MGASKKLFQFSQVLGEIASQWSIQNLYMPDWEGARVMVINYCVSHLND